MSDKPKLRTFEELSVFAEIETAPTQPVLHHYTRRTGLLGILQSTQLWASNAKYLNDARELTTAHAVAMDILSDHMFSEGSIEGQLFELVKQVLRDLIETQMDVFVFSLSETDDLLSQWRAYSRAGDGYAIGFDVRALTTAAREANGHLSKCRYDKDTHRRLMTLVINDALADARGIKDKNFSDEDALSEAIQTFMVGFLLVSPIIKDEAFREEREWRLLFPFSNVWDKKVKFRDGGKLLIPYLPVSLKHNDFLTDLRIGPTPHQELEKRGASGLLTVFGFPDAKIFNSAVPFRDW